MSDNIPIETREFPTAVIASLSTGRLMCKFEEMHEAAEYLMGHPIWTHHFASKPLCEAMRRKVRAQCPAVPTDIPGINRENWQQKLVEIEAKVGPVCTIQKGDGATAMDPREGIPKGKPTLILGERQ